jgi:hypothetical protein
MSSNIRPETDQVLPDIAEFLALCSDAPQPVRTPVHEFVDLFVA